MDQTNHSYQQTKYCTQCGEQINQLAEICPKCGVRQGRVAMQQGEGKDWLTTLLLCVFVGGLGVHRFYTGHTVIGIIQLFTLGGCGIWALIDLILIVTNGYTDSEGQPLRRS